MTKIASVRNIAVGLECYVKKNGKYLMLHRNSNKKVLPGVWLAPGGKIEPNEGLFECAKREIFEETGLKIKNLKIKAIGNAVMQDLGVEFFFHFITADWKEGKIILEKDIGELAWFSPKEIYKLPNIMAELPKVLPVVFNGNNDIVSYKAVYSHGNTLKSFTLDLC